MAENRFKEQARKLEAARYSFEMASAETRVSKLEVWKKELGWTEEMQEMLSVETVLQLDNSHSFTENIITAKINVPEAE